MTEKRMVIISNNLMSKIDEHRGQYSRTDFVAGCVNKLFSELEVETGKGTAIRGVRREKAEAGVEPGDYVTRKDFERFRDDMDRLQQEFTGFFIKYGEQLAQGTLSKEGTERFSEELKRLLQL